MWTKIMVASSLNNEEQIEVPYLKWPGGIVIECHLKWKDNLFSYVAIHERA